MLFNIKLLRVGGEGFKWDTRISFPAWKTKVRDSHVIN
jgi:hypothetical protein